MFLTHYSYYLFPGVILLFSVPKVYETYQVQIDNYVGMAKAQLDNVINMWVVSGLITLNPKYICLEFSLRRIHYGNLYVSIAIFMEKGILD